MSMRTDRWVSLSAPREVVLDGTIEGRAFKVYIDQVPMFERVLSDQVGRIDVVNHRGDRPWQVPGLAQAHVAGIGVDLHPEDVKELFDPNRLDLGDLHRRSST